MDIHSKFHPKPHGQQGALKQGNNWPQPQLQLVLPSHPIALSFRKVSRYFLSFLLLISYFSLTHRLASACQQNPSSICNPVAKQRRTHDFFFILLYTLFFLLLLSTSLHPPLCQRD